MRPISNIVSLMPESHRRAVFSTDCWRQLHRIGTVQVAPQADDHGRPEVRRLLAEADVVITGTGTARLSEADLDAAPRLQLLVHAAGSLRPVIGDYAYDRGITLSSHAALNALPVAEFTLAMILLELKGVPRIAHTYRQAKQAVDVDALLADSGVYRRRVGIISASHIGRRVIELLRPFDCEVVLHDPLIGPQDAERLGVELVDLATLMATSDVVSVHAPLLPETRGMIDAELLAMLRDDAVLVNTARGALIDEAALLAELRTGRIRAVIDVTDPEVPDPGSDWWGLTNVVLTPHVAGSRGRELLRIGESVVAEVERYSRGLPLRHVVPQDRYAASA